MFNKSRYKARKKLNDAIKKWRCTLEHKKTDFVIIGSGPAGLAAAIEAAEAGCDVIVLEKLGTTGGAASVNYTPAGTVAGHTLTINEMPKHSHTQSIHSYSSDNGYLSESGSGIASDYVSDALEGQTSQTGGGASHNHGFTGTQATHTVTPST